MGVTSVGMVAGSVADEGAGGIGEGTTITGVAEIVEVAASSMSSSMIS